MSEAASRQVVAETPAPAARGAPLLRRLGQSNLLGFGFLIAIVVGVAVGVLMGYFTFVYKLLEPVTELIRPIPSPAYVPVAIIFLGIDDPMKIFVIAFA